MAEGQDNLELRLGGSRIRSMTEPENSGEGQDGSDHQPFASSSKNLLHRTPLPQEWEEEEEEDSEANMKNITKSAPFASVRHTAFEGSQRTSSDVDVQANPASFDLEVGESSHRGLAFVAFKLVKKYPYLYVGKSNQPEVGAFFKENLLGNYAWDFFYILDPTGSKDPLLLVPSVQFEQFLRFANAKTGRNLAIPRGGARSKFFFTFGSLDTPVPRFLGRASSEEAYEGLQHKAHGLPQDSLSDLSPAALQSFGDLVDRVYSSASSKRKSPEAAKRKQMQRQKSFGRTTKRVQRYLGLRARAAYASQSASVGAGWNVGKPAPFIGGSSVRFICVDVEAYERNTSIVTEIGLAVLDTEDIVDIPPGDDGENWFSQIKTFHLRVAEYSYMVNHEFVKGCPESFNFGKSELVPSAQIARRVGSIIGDGASDDKRPVVLVGHGIGQDLAYLSKIGYNVWRVPHVLDEVDTSSMYQRLEQGQHGRGLETVCRELHHPGYDFHNAGNDAYYALQSMIVMALRQLSSPPKSSNLESAAQGSDDKDWSDGERDDGGPPQRSQEPVEKAARQAAPQNREPRW